MHVEIFNSSSLIIQTHISENCISPLLQYSTIEFTFGTVYINGSPLNNLVG